MDDVIPCEQNDELKNQIRAYAEALKEEAHTLGSHGLSERDFYDGGVFRGAIERIRGQFSASSGKKQNFVALVLNHMQDQGVIVEWDSAGERNRHDYDVVLPTGRKAVIELKGCLDGNNTNIFERPAHAEEFIIWSVCTNSGADPRHNVWSGIHTRLSTEIIENSKQVDGLVVWDWLCGTICRRCPKIVSGEMRSTVLGQYLLPPPCVYLFPRTIPSVRNNPSPAPHEIHDVQLLKAFHECFGGRDEELHSVKFTVANRGSETVRTTEISRNDVVKHSSGETPIRRK